MALWATHATAASVDQVTARATAARFVQAQASKGKLKSHGASQLLLAHAEAATTRDGYANYYVFNTSDGSAFVIVAGDDRAEAVLGYGEGTIDMDRMPDNLQWLLDTYSEQMEYLHSNPGARVERAAPYNDVTIPPMVTCNWSQSEPYYNMCPVVDGERSVTGCVATAMAQVMYYWQYPAEAPALRAYTTRSRRIHCPALASSPIDWANMVDSYAGEYTSQQANAVALLMRYCGQSCQMDYSPNGSGSYVENQLQGMHLFGYTSATMLSRSDYSIEQWDALMQEDMLAGRPILYAGVDALAGGHAFVLDGYYDGRYHINWGWGGTGDGYFMLGAFNVRGYTFTSQQEMLHNVHPSTTSPAQADYDFAMGKVYYKYTDDASGLLVTAGDTQSTAYQGTVVVPDSVDHGGKRLPVVGIAASAFRDCKELVAVTLPSTLQHIGQYAFKNCINLGKVAIPQGVTRIDPQAFAYCYSLTMLSLPEGLKSIGERAFTDCLSLQQVNIPSLEAWLGISFADVLANPLYCAHQLSVDNKAVTQVEITGADVDRISQYAFAGSTLTRVVIDGVHSIERAAFKDCTGITQLTLRGNIAEVGREAFAGCTALQGVAIPQSLTQLSNSMFASCSSLKEVDIPASVTAIGNNAFKDCTALTDVSWSESISTIGSGAFNGCTALQHIELPQSLTAIEENAFGGCTGLKEVQFADSLTVLGVKAFAGCTALANLSLPNSLSTIQDQAFANCEALKTIVIPDGVKVIGHQAFYKCLYLVNVTLGSGVTEIGDQAFDNNPRMKSITSMAATPPAINNSNCFMRNIYNNATLRVPARLVKVYKKSGLWAWFTHIQGIVTTSDADVNADGEVTVADVNAVIAAILTQNRLEGCDVNGDGEVSVADVNAIISLILGQEES